MYGVDLEKLRGFSFVKIGGSERDSVQKIGKLRFSFDQLLLWWMPLQFVLHNVSIFCAFANGDTAVVRINSFAPPSVGHVQTPFL